MEKTATFILCAPQGVGKTQYAERIAAGLGCRNIVDGWDGESLLPPSTLALTHDGYVMQPGCVAMYVETRAGMELLVDALSSRPVAEGQRIGQ